MTTKIEFPEADYYDCHDGERLSHETPEEAVEAWVERWLSPKCDTAKVIEGIGSVTVGCFQRAEVSDGWKDRTTSRLLDHVDGMFSEDYGAPDGDEGRDAAEGKMRAAVEAYLAAAAVRPCDQIGEVTLTPDQVEAMLREHCPDWFEDDSAEVTSD